MANYSKCEGIKSHSQTLVGQSKPQVREKKQEDSETRRLIGACKY